MKTASSLRKEKRGSGKKSIAKGEEMEAHVGEALMQLAVGSVDQQGGDSTVERKGGPQGDGHRADGTVAKETAERRVSKHMTPEQEAVLHSQRIRALNALRDSTDLVAMGTALVLVEELEAEEYYKSDQLMKSLVDQAGVAVPYLIHKTLISLLTEARPKGPGFGQRAAQSITSALVSKVGIDSCTANISEETLVEHGGLRMVDAQRVLPHLLRMGNGNRDKVKKIRSYILETDNAHGEKVKSSNGDEAARAHGRTSQRRPQISHKAEALRRTQPPRKRHKK